MGLTRRGYRQATLVGAGAVHTHLTLNELSPRGDIAPHMHSFEEGFYILDGQAVVGFDQRAFELEAGDFGAIKVGTVHAWRNIGTTPLRWLQSLDAPAEAGGPGA